MPKKLSLPVKISLWAAITWFGARLYGFRLESLGPFAAWICGTWISYLIIVLAWRTLGRRWFSPLKDLPGPEVCCVLHASPHNIDLITIQGGNIIFQNASAIFDEPLGTQITNWVNTIQNEGLLHFHGFMGTEYLVATNVESLSDVLTNRSYHFQKTSGLRRYAERFFGRGLVIQEGNEHKKNRKSFVQVFNQRQVNKLKPILSSKATQIVQQLSEKCVSDSEKKEKFAAIKINEFAKMISFDVMGIIALGLDFNSMLGQNLEIFDLFQTLFASDCLKKSHFMWHNCAPPWLITMFPSDMDRKMDFAHRQLRQSLQRLIPEKRASLKSTDLSDEDMLTQIACSGSFTQEEIIPQIVTTLAAGYVAPSWAMLDHRC
jgi:cytochrome P450